MEHPPPRQKWTSYYHSPTNKAPVSGIHLIFTESVDLIIVWPNCHSSQLCSAQKLIGNWLVENPEKRKDIFLCTKFGYTRLPGDILAPACSDPAYIPQALEATLKDLQTEYINLYYQHRVDHKVPIELVLEALHPAVESGTVH